MKDENIKGDILEVGATPDERSLLNSNLLSNAETKVGINLNGGSYSDFEVKEGNANNMMFDDDTFDIILCNATLEHDKNFWKTISEIKRVAKEDCTIIIGIPGYTEKFRRRKLNPRKLLYEMKNKFKENSFQKYPHIAISELKNWIIATNRYSYTPTYVVHDAPGDYYRFSKQSVEEVFLKNCIDKEIEEVMMPPRIIGKGVYTKN